MRKTNTAATWRTETPEPGWRGWGSNGVTNPRPPTVPATLHLNLEQYYTACALIGLLSSQSSEPNRDWVAGWSCDVGQAVAAEAKKRWSK